MIEVINISKHYGKIKAIEEISLQIKEGEIYGLIGSNGSGKTTLLRMISGILRTDSGSIRVDDQVVYENSEVKHEIFFVADESFYFPGYTCKEMKNFYKSIYERFDEELFSVLAERFTIDLNQKLSSLSKGTRKQFFILVGISSQTKYLILDETFDGLDPVVRQTVKSIIAQEVCKRNFTPIISSHNLREIEDICENVGFIHKGKVLVSNSLEELKHEIYKVQCILNESELEHVVCRLQVIGRKTQGSLTLLTIRGERGVIETVLDEISPRFYELLPLTLEELFISETEVQGYEVKSDVY